MTKKKLPQANASSVRRELITLRRIFDAGVRDFFRSAWLSVAAIAVMVVALAVILFTVVISITMRNAINELSEDLKVSVYLYDGTTEKERQNLGSAIEAQPGTESVAYVSKDEAYERFTESFNNDSELLQGLSLVGADTLPASFEVTSRQLDKIDDLEKVLKQEEFKNIVESYTLGRTDARAAIDRAIGLQRFLVTSSVVAGIIFTVISILIIFNTIRIAIFSRKEEIANMKLIGATPGYIRGPFLVEAGMYGVVAAIIATTGIYGIIYSVGERLITVDGLGFTQTYIFLTNPLTIVTLLIGAACAGIIVGIFSSDLAMRKHLKLKHW